MVVTHYDLIIIGAGPAGLLAAIESHQPSRKTVVLEKMPKPALKLGISGKGRCNITNDASREEFISHFGKNGRFLRSAFAGFGNTDLLQYFERLGVACKLEQGGRYFPKSDDAREVVEALLRKVRSLKIPLHTDSEVIGIARGPDARFVVTVRTRDRADTKKRQALALSAEKVVLATGGKSYPKTGSDGTGYRLASHLGHTVTPISPALVPIETGGDTARRLQGLSLRNVKVRAWCTNRKVGERFGEMLFTDSGVSGPIILSLSGSIVKCIDAQQDVVISIDLKPALDHERLDMRLQREIAAHSRQGFKSLLKTLLPRKLIPVFLERLQVPEGKQLSQLTHEERTQLRMLLKEFQLEVTGYRSFDEAIVTAGGISTKEINPHTMESKLVPGLYFAGEMIDIDADTGGFNLQAAFSTGFSAGRAIAEESAYAARAARRSEEPESETGRGDKS
jgi:predicted Rossmann fold flavoprotein